MTITADILTDLGNVFYAAGAIGTSQATYYENGVGGGVTVTVRFSDNTPMESPETGEIMGSGPSLDIQTADVPNLAHKDTFLIAATTYLVELPGEASGHGETNNVRLIKQ